MNEIVTINNIDIAVLLLDIKSNNLDDLSSEIAKIKVKNKKSAVIIRIDAEIKFSVTDLAVLIEFIAQNEMITIGINSKNNELLDYANVLGIVVIDNVDKINKPSLPKDDNYIPPLVFAEKIISKQVYTKDRDLLITKNVASSIELISGNSVYVHAKLEGKVIAGALGNSDAVIFIKEFMAELVSIAGVYRRFDEVPDRLKNKQVIVSLVNGGLNFKVIDVNV